MTETPPEASVPPAVTRTEVVPRANATMRAVAVVVIVAVSGLAVFGAWKFQQLYDEVVQQGDAQEAQGDALAAQADRLSGVADTNAGNLAAIRRQNRRLAQGIGLLDQGVTELAALNERMRQSTLCAVGLLLTPPEGRLFIPSDRIARLCGLRTAEVEFLRAATRGQFVPTAPFPGQ